MLVKDAMTRRAETIGPDETLQAAARKMRETGVGALVVCEGDLPVGLITDRDVVVRSTAQGRDPARADVRSAMTPQLVSCAEEDDLGAAAALMGERAVRRLAVLGPGQELVGLLSVDDLAPFSRTLAGQVIERIRAPERPVEQGPWPWWGNVTG
jgi:CBS domain-containing protein